MHTKVKATVYAAKLRKKLAELKKARPGLLKAYEAGVRQWRADLAEWLRKVGWGRAAALKPDKERPRYGDQAMFSTQAFFAGAPVPPEYPTDKQIRDIQNLLRQLGITGQATVTLSTEDVARYLGGEGEEQPVDPKTPIDPETVETRPFTPPERRRPGSKKRLKFLLAVVMEVPRDLGEEGGLRVEPAILDLVRDGHDLAIRSAALVSSASTRAHAGPFVLDFRPSPDAEPELAVALSWGEALRRARKFWARCMGAKVPAAPEKPAAFGVHEGWVRDHVARHLDVSCRAGSDLRVSYASRGPVLRVRKVAL